jgi:hypothetical protein
MLNWTLIWTVVAALGALVVGFVLQATDSASGKELLVLPAPIIVAGGIAANWGRIRSALGAARLVLVCCVIGLAWAVGISAPYLAGIGDHSRENWADISWQAQFVLLLIIFWLLGAAIGVVLAAIAFTSSFQRGSRELESSKGGHLV